MEDRISVLIEKGTLDDLREANEMLVAVIGAKRRQKDVVALSYLSVGDTVSFTGKRGRHCRGKIVAFGRTGKATVAVVPLFGTVPERWNVPCSMLRKETEVPRV